MNGLLNGFYLTNSSLAFIIVYSKPRGGARTQIGKHSEVFTTWRMLNYFYNTGNLLINTDLIRCMMCFGVSLRGEETACWHNANHKQKEAEAGGGHRGKSVIHHHSSLQLSLSKCRMELTTVLHVLVLQLIVSIVCHSHGILRQFRIVLLPLYIYLTG